MSPDPLTITFSALADPTRREILRRLAGQTLSVTELSRPFDMTMPAITKHLKVLQRAGLIARSRQAQSRPCHLQAGPLKDAAGWIEHYRQFWDESFDRLDEYLKELQADQAGRHRATPKHAAARHRAVRRKHKPSKRKGTST